jgi:Anti-sigma-K factor rskA
VKHEHFEELCAAASIGQATAEELAQLEQHTSECDACRQAYFDYLNVASQEFAAPRQAPSLSSRDLEEALNSELFTRRFFDRAKREGIVFSRDVDKNTKVAAPVGALPPRRLFRYGWAVAVAAGVVLAVVGSSSYFHLSRRSEKRQGTSPAIAKSNMSEPPTTTALDRRIQELSAVNSDLRVQIERLSTELRKKDERLIAAETNLKTTSQDRRNMVLDREALQAKLDSALREVGKTESLLATAQQEASAQKAYAKDIEAKSIVDQAELKDLEDALNEKSALLDQDRQLLRASHHVTDLMGARNLHIVDVVDTDARGKSRPAFGRIFFTEDKSLIFYAYDLNEQKMQKANYQYQIWAKKEGPNQRPLKLGIFYSDDRTQSRWMFRCDDPKVLREIDSVFVTFERSDGDPSHPEGPSLMYAYLRGQPNHP